MRQALWWILAMALWLRGLPAHADLPRPQPPPSPPAAAGPAPELSLPDAARLALARNPKIAAALARLEAAREEAEVAASPARPQITLTGFRDYQRTPQGPPVEVSLFGRTQSFQSQPLTYQSVRAQLELRQLLFDGGRVAARIAQARAVQGQAEQGLAAAWNGLYLEVQNAYLEALEARALLEATRQSLEVARQNLQMAEAQFRAGTAARAEVVFARVPVAQAELEVTRAEQRVATTSAALNRVLGLPQDTLLQLVEPQDPGPVTRDLPTSIQEALAGRPELLALRAEEEAARRGVEAARRESHPQLYAVGDVSGAGYQGQVLPRSEGWRLALELNWPLSQGNRTTHEVAAAEARLREAQARYQDESQAVELQVREAYLAVGAAAQAYAAAEVEQERAREALAMAQGQYRAGVGTFLQVDQARADLSRATARRLSAFYDYQRARARLAWARGETPPVSPPARQ
jgi:outer membrane protein TolC